MTESTEQATAPAAPAAAPAKKASTRKAAPRKASAKKASSKKATAKKSTVKRSSAKSAPRKSGTAAKASTAKKATSKRTEFPTLKTEAACERVMKENLAGYKQYQVERDKNRNEKGMEKHRLAYRTYKNAYTQLLALRKAAGKGRRNAKAE